MAEYAIPQRQVISPLAGLGTLIDQYYKGKRDAEDAAIAQTRWQRSFDEGRRQFDDRITADKFLATLRENGADGRTKMQIEAGAKDTDKKIASNEKIHGDEMEYKWGALDWSMSDLNPANMYGVERAGGQNLQNRYMQTVMNCMANPSMCAGSQGTALGLGALGASVHPQPQPQQAGVTLGPQFLRYIMPDFANGQANIEFSKRGSSSTFPYNSTIDSIDLMGN
jgi:hypothetical protein